MNAVCILQNYGNVLFSQCCEKHAVIVTFDLQNFKKFATHAIHIHEFGDLSDGCKSLGPHYNPTNVTHGSILYPEKPRHAGDLINNFKTDKNGKFNAIFVDDLISIKDIVGRSVVIHDGVDDLGLGGDAESLLTGNAGTRMVCGIIGWKK